MRNLLLLCLVAFSTAAHSLDMNYSEVVRIPMESASEFGISLTQQRSVGFNRYNLVVGESFPCSVESISISTFDDRGSVILSLQFPSVAPVQFDVRDASISNSRIDFNCQVVEKYATPSYSMELQRNGS